MLYGYSYMMRPRGYVHLEDLESHQHDPNLLLGKYDDLLESDDDGDHDKETQIQMTQQTALSSSSSSKVADVRTRNTDGSTRRSNLTSSATVTADVHAVSSDFHDLLLGH